MDELLAAHRHASKNRSEIEASTICGCFSCLQVFAPDEIVAWDGLDMSNFNNPDAATDGETALCPRCGSDSVLGDKSHYAITPQFLGRMHEAWCQRTIIRPPRPKK